MPRGGSAEMLDLLLEPDTLYVAVAKFHESTASPDARVLAQRRRRRSLQVCHRRRDGREDGCDLGRGLLFESQAAPMSLVIDCDGSTSPTVASMKGYVLRADSLSIG
jgi:hypothetical protein